MATDSNTKDFYTVSEIASVISGVFQHNFSSAVKIKGEISAKAEASPYSHWYFTIKDKSALLNGTCWKSRIAALKFVPKPGDEVFCYGHLKTYPMGSVYQLDVERFEPVGKGDLARQLLELKEKFLKEGLFAPEHKKPLPHFPKTIGVITSETGAVIHDIMQTVEARFPSHILLYPVPVQGVGAGLKIAEAIRKMNELPVDVIIVARGGGSLEDLWEFNSEAVVRAVYNSKKPIISGVGHETDTTLIDYAADKIALTPTKAGMLVVPEKSSLKNELQEKSLRLNKAMENILNKAILKLQSYKLPDLQYLLNIKEQQLDSMNERLKATVSSSVSKADERYNGLKNRLKPIIANIMTLASNRLKSDSQLLESYSYKSVLSRGFTMITDKNGKLLTSITDLQKDQKIALTLHDGKADAIITSLNSD